MEDIWKSYCNYNLYAVEHQIKIKIAALKEMIVDNENSVLKIQNNFDTLLETIDYNTIDEKHLNSFEEQLIDKELIVENLLIQKRYSTCLLIFMIFEGTLKEVCKHSILSEYEFNLENLKRKDDLSKFKDFFLNTVNINFTKIEPSFTKIKQQKVIRNRIAHNNGEIKHHKDIQVVQGLIIKNKIIKISGVEYFDFLLREIELFFKELILEID